MKAHSLYRKRLFAHRFGMVLSCLAMILGLTMLLWILLTLLYKGFGALSWSLLTQNTPEPGEDAGGLLNPMVGSIMMVGIATLISTPIGISAGIYLAEYGEKNRLVHVIRFIADVMLSTPSIVIGLFVYAVYVVKVGHFSGWAGAFALSLLAIPIITRTTDNMLRLVPNNLREAAFALGAPSWKVALQVRLRAVKAGVITGVLLALARITGETAPLLFTALNSQFFSMNMNQPMANLPVVINQFAMSPFDNWIPLAWGGALVITCGVLILNILSRTLFKQSNSGT